MSKITDNSTANKIKTLRLLTIIVILIMLALSSASAIGANTSSSLSALSSSTSVGTSDWSQFHGNWTHNGYSNSSGPTTPTLAWSKIIGGSYDGLEEYNGFLIVSNSQQVTNWSPQGGISGVSGSISELYQGNGA